MQLTTEFQKVLETSTKVTQNVTGYLRLYLKYGGRDETNNKDIIYYEIRQYAYNPYGNYLAWEWTGDLAWNIKLGTTTKASGTYKQTPAIYTDGKERVRVSGSWEQEHNPDGTWSSSISVEGYVYKTNLSASGNIELPTIPRKTTIKATDAKIGSISTIYLTINSNTFNHTLSYAIGSGSYNVFATNVKGNVGSSTTYPWEVPDTIYTSIPNAQQIQLNIKCQTYNSSGGYVGESITTMWASVNEEVARPTFNVTIKNDGTSGTTYKLTGSENAFIKDYTNAIIDANAVARKSATLQEYRVVNGNKSSTEQDTTINAISTGKFSFFVKDSRQLSPSTGYQTDKYVDTFIEYFAPKVLTPTIERTEQTSTEIVATLSGTYWNGNFGAVTNVGTLQYSWRSKLAGSNEWGEWSSWTTPTISGSNFYINNLSLGDIYATNSSYDFQFRFIDALSNLDPTKIVTTATQNVTISTPIVEIYEDAVNVNGNLMRNGFDFANFASMYTNGTQKFEANSSQVTVFTGTNYDVKTGDLDINTTYCRIDIPLGTEYIEIGGQTCGNTSAWCLLVVNDQYGNWVGESGLLVQPGGNGYWSRAFPVKILKLDKTKSHYLYMRINAYNVTEFYLNAGFSHQNTNMWVKKLK